MNKNSKNKKRKVMDAESKRKAGKRFLIIFVSSFLSLALILGAVLGIVSAVRSSGAAVSYNGVVMDTETVSYFASYYKKVYMTSLTSSGISGVSDVPAFWNKTADGSEKTYGELLIENTKEYIRNIVAANYLYESYAVLSGSDRKNIDEAANDVLKNSGAANEKELNSILKPYGFSYKTLKKVAEMIYKADSVYGIMYGQNGSYIESMTLPGAYELCEEYLKEYTHVKLIIINTETKFVLEDGNKVVGEDGNYKTEALTSKEREELLAKVEEIRGYIAAIGTGKPQMGEIMFESYINELSSGEVAMPDGYYFHPNASYTQNFPASHSEVVRKSYEMAVESYAEVAVNNGYCFIYKSNPESAAFILEGAEKCFTDFYSDLSVKLFNENLKAYGNEVAFTNKFSNIDIITLPYNYAYIPRF